MKRIIRVVLLLTLATVVAYVVNLVWLQPLSAHQFFNRSFILFALNKPEMLSELGVLEQFGITFHQDDFDDESESAVDRDIAKVKENIRILESYDRRALTGQEALSYDIFSWFTRTNLRTADEFR